MTWTIFLSVFSLFLLSSCAHDFEISEVESTVQFATIATGSELENVMEIAILRSEFDRNLYYGRQRLQDMTMIPDYANEGSNPYYGNKAYENIPYSMVQQTGVAKLICRCIECEQFDPEVFPECSGDICEYETFGSSSDLPPRFLMPMPAIEDVSSMFYSLFFGNGPLQIHGKTVAKTFTAIKVLRTKVNITREWTHYVPESLKFDHCRLRFEHSDKSLTKRELRYPSTQRMLSMGGMEVGPFSKRFTPCDYEKMASYMYRIRQAYKRMKNLSDTSEFERIQSEVAQIKSSGDWINCRDYMNTVVHKEERKIDFPQDKVCRKEVGTNAWISDPCCNVGSGDCVNREDNPVMNVPTQLDQEKLLQYGEISAIEKGLIFSISKNAFNEENCIDEPIDSGITRIPFSDILDNMVRKCDEKYAFNGSPDICEHDNDCLTECNHDTNRCKIPFSNRMQLTLSCWENYINPKFAEAFMQVVFDNADENVQHSLEKQLENIASKEVCIGETSWKFKDNETELCLADSLCTKYQKASNITDVDNETDSNITFQNDSSNGQPVCVQWKMFNRLGNTTDTNVLQELVESTVTKIRSKAVSEVLQCKYSLLHENYQSLSCEKNLHRSDNCILYENIWPTVSTKQIEKGKKMYLKDSSVTIETESGLLTEQVLAVDPRTMMNALNLIKENHAKETGEISVVPNRMETIQSPFDSIYTSYLMRNAKGDYRIVSSPEYGGITLEDKNKILSFLPSYALTHELDPYAVVMNKKGSVVAQVVGNAVMLKPLEGDIPNANLCLRIFPGLPVDKESYPIPDFGYIDHSLNTFVPMGLDDIQVTREGEELCARVTLHKDGLAYAPIYRYENWEDVDPCIYDACMVCNGDNSTCSGCDQIPFSGKEFDQCHVCGGDNSECKDCKGVINGPAKEDICGECEGDGSKCICCPGMTNAPTCDVEDKCYKVQCLNGGVCSQSTGLCSCTLGFTGKNCEIRDCNSNGFYSPKNDACVCDRGWAGVNCTTCGVPKSKGDKFVCSPYGDNGDYILTALPSHIADEIVLKKGNVENMTEVKDLKDILIAMRNGNNHAPIWPGTKGYDGYIRDCSCKRTPIQEEKRDKHTREELGKMIFIDEQSRIQVPLMFTKSELYMISEHHHLSDQSKTAIRQRNKRLGLLHPRDTEPKTYDDISERCLQVVDTRNKEVDAHENYFMRAIQTRSNGPSSCTKNVTEEKYGAVFWVVVGIAAFAILLLIVVFACIVLYIFEAPFMKRWNRRVDELTLRSEGKMKRNRSVSTNYKRKKRRGKKIM